MRAVPKHIYPFESNFLELDKGLRYHYVDEGSGPPVVMVHGNPTWSFFYRDVVQTLKGNCQMLNSLKFDLIVHKKFICFALEPFFDTSYIEMILTIF